MLHSYNQFHAAGHGTFFSGQLRHGESRFLWVYDCGSRRKGRMKTLVQDLNRHAKTNEIHMLSISHFDVDHVNGLFELLNVFTVERLFLPYLPFEKRLQIVCNLDLDVADSTEAMLFTLDPVGLLDLRNLTNRVKKIFFVVGGEDNKNAEQIDINELPTTPNILGDQVNIEYPRILSDSQLKTIGTIPHAMPITVCDKLWEFMFYNNALPKGAAQVSGKSLVDIQEEVKQILKKFDLNSTTPKQIESWREELRKCYEKHFGNNPKARNDISLCLLSRPEMNREITQCSLFRKPFANIGCAHTLVPISLKGKKALLLTGDISVDKQKLQHLKNHFKDNRWNDVHVMQIPHHGSKHSWNVNNASFCQHEYSIFCVPDVDSTGSHPHLSVLDDLEDRHPLYANYSNSIVYCFHIC